MSRMMACAAALAVMGVAHAVSAAEAVVLQLRGPPQFEFAGYYAALWQGFYAEAGLTVDIQPGAPRGQTPTDTVRELAEGRAQFGVGGAELAIRAAQGMPLLLLAPIFSKAARPGINGPVPISAHPRLPAKGKWRGSPRAVFSAWKWPPRRA